MALCLHDLHLVWAYTGVCLSALNIYYLLLKHEIFDVPLWFWQVDYLKMEENPNKISATDTCIAANCSCSWMETTTLFMYASLAKKPCTLSSFLTWKTKKIWRVVWWKRKWGWHQGREAIPRRCTQIHTDSRRSGRIEVIKRWDSIRRKSEDMKL